MTEKEKAALGMWYDANYDQELLQARLDAKDLCFEYNQTKPSLLDERQKILTQLFGYFPDNLEIVQPFMCDYGNNITIKEDVFINSYCYFMDCAKISIGSHVFMGPYCGLYTASHSLDVDERNKGIENALPIIIEDNVWLGANVSILQGVTIGEGSVIAAGSVVNKDIPPHVIAGGMPCRVIKKTDE
ncbi:MAG: sugar O-acetyltransferase [Coprobacillus sp.]